MLATGDVDAAIETTFVVSLLLFSVVVPIPVEDSLEMGISRELTTTEEA